MPQCMTCRFRNFFMLGDNRDHKIETVFYSWVFIHEEERSKRKRTSNSNVTQLIFNSASRLLTQRTNKIAVFTILKIHIRQILQNVG